MLLVSIISLITWLVLVCLSFAVHLHKRDYVSRIYYAIEFDASSPVTPADVGRVLQARWEGPIGQLPQHHLFSAVKGVPDIYTSLHQLRKRDLTQEDRVVVEGIKWIKEQKPKRLVKRQPVWTSRGEVAEKRKKPGDKQGGLMGIIKELDISDPGFSYQWHLFNDADPGNDINVTGVWREGVLGKGVVVAIVDDGLDVDSEDLKANFFASGSYDFNDHTAIPRPQLFEDTHGTRCAGEIAAVKNDICGVGVAYEAKVSGIRILSSEITEADEATALNYGYQDNHIYSCSWGPPDNGRAVEAPEGLVKKAILQGIEKGRGGLGSIYVFASGNGGGFDDNCNFDGYTNSIYTITIGAIDRMNMHPYYSERCSAQLAVTYSSGIGSYIYTTDVVKISHETCTARHGGTSAAAPIAAGIFALVLSVRPDLTWRDMQHLCVQTAIPVSLDDDDWQETSAGRAFNHKYGYGKLDAYRIVEAARNHVKVGPQLRVKMPIVRVDTEIPQDETGLYSVMRVTEDSVADLKRVEHVTVTVNMDHERRGDVEIYLMSPHNVTSQLAARRRFDLSNEGLKNWTFMSVKHWEEEPTGLWTLRVVDKVNPEAGGRFIDWRIVFYGEAKPNNTAAPSSTIEGPLPQTLATETMSDGAGPIASNAIADLDEMREETPPNQYGYHGWVPYLLLGAAALTAALAIWLTYRRLTGQNGIEAERQRDHYEFEALNVLDGVDDEDDDDEESTLKEEVPKEGVMVVEKESSYSYSDED
ncbi:uncharacterized protein VTP21DRAFT_10599 [Calcarisporiella thermophila]|uniref:uncharacterized protein n=1 Tax=Calcarisporiella thermophila TaxID=911321 RepID=UPI003744B12D